MNRPISPMVIDAAGASAVLLSAAVAWFVWVAPTGAAEEGLRAARAEAVALGNELGQTNASLRAARARLESERKKAATGSFKLAPASQRNVRVAQLVELAQSGLSGTERGEVKVGAPEGQALPPGQASPVGQAGLKLDEITPAPMTPAGRFTKVPIRLAGSGTFDATIGFLRALHTRFPDTAVRGFRLFMPPDADPSRQSVSAPPPRPGFSFDLVWYAAPDEGPGRPGGAGPAAGATGAAGSGDAGRTGGNASAGASPR
jgi:hypothetical protein